MDSADFSAEVTLTGQSGVSVPDLFSLRRKGILRRNAKRKAGRILPVRNTFVFNELTDMTITRELDMSKPVLKAASSGQLTPLILKP